MTPQERAALAEQLLANKLFHEIFKSIETDATEACIWATDDETRARAAMRVQAVRSFQSDCQSAIDSIRARKAAPA